MVLINKLTIDDINAALIHLQRSQGEVVGGVKSDTPIQNITIQNSGGGTGTNYDSVIHTIQERLKAHDTAITEDEVRLTVAESENATQTEQISAIFELLSELSDNGVQSLQFDATSRYLILYTQDGNTYDVEIPSETVTMSFDSNTNKLIFEMGSQTQEVTLPYINTNQIGVAGGVASLDANGRVPYSQLPESAMTFLGEWDASTNTPTLADGTGTNGDFYICSAGGTVNFGTVAEPREVTFVVNDRVIYEGGIDEWVRLPAGQVSSVNGMSGDVQLNATNVPYDSNMSIKQKIDSSTAVQSDWTETDSADPSFIKHKIPIWITQGSADDNMSPIDSVTDGSMRPVTSNAVYDKHYLTSADITNQVTVDNMQSVSSNAVAQKLNDYATNTTLVNYKFNALGSANLNTIGWYKILECGFRNVAFCLSIDLWSNYNNTPSSAHKIQLNYGWLGARAIDIAKDGNTVFDQIRICYNSNNTDVMAVYVHYNKNVNNGVWFNVSGGTSRLKNYSFVVDNTAWQNTLTYNLGTDGIYDNGTKLT